ASLLVNVQHPRTDNPFPYNHSLTLAINGFDKLAAQSRANGVDPFTNLAIDEVAAPTNSDVFTVFPNPTTRTIYLNKASDVAIYNVEGQRVLVRRNVTEVNVSDLTPGMYFVQNAKGDILKLQVQ
ncbi:MAG: T9SS type A sorting domain-containing protein, partial [Bacteroidota bacterium]